MIISLADDHCKNLSFTTYDPWLDDQTVRTEHHLQKRLRQRAPLTLDGEREILWRCSCSRKPWYRSGHSSFFVCLSAEQRSHLAHRLGADASILSLLPASICPICAAIHLGRMPGIEEDCNGRGYRFTWTGTKQPHLRVCCIIEKNISSIKYSPNVQNSPFATFATPGDVVLSPLKQVRSILHCLTTLPEPEREEAMSLSESTCDLLNRRDRLEPGLAWCGYSWIAQCSALGDVLVALGMTFPSSSVCSLGFLVACWQQVARTMERVL